MHLAVISAKQIAEWCEHGAPDQRPGEVREQEENNVHAGKTRRQRDQSSHTWKELAEEHSRTAITLEAALCPPQICRPKQDPFAVPADPVGDPTLAEYARNPIEWERTESRPKRSDKHHAIERHPSTTGLEPAQRHDRLRWKREDHVLDCHEQRDSPVTQGVDEMDHPSKHRGIRTAFIIAR